MSIYHHQWYQPLLTTCTINDPETLLYTIVDRKYYTPMFVGYLATTSFKDLDPDVLNWDSVDNSKTHFQFY